LFLVIFLPALLRTTAETIASAAVAGAKRDAGPSPASSPAPAPPRTARSRRSRRSRTVVNRA
jgi:hypothetical protein